MKLLASAFYTNFKCRHSNGVPHASKLGPVLRIFFNFPLVNLVLILITLMHVLIHYIVSTFFQIHRKVVIWSKYLCFLLHSYLFIKIENKIHFIRIFTFESQIVLSARSISYYIKLVGQWI